MAKIFVSHSRKDKILRDFFSTAFATTKVEAVYEEIEAIVEGNRPETPILSDLGQSNALTSELRATLR